MINEYNQDVDFCLFLSLAIEDCPDETKKNRLNSAEFQRILKAKSSHDWIVKEVSVSLSL